MSREDIFATIQDVMERVLSIPRDTVSVDSNIVEDFGADSLDIVDLIVELEYEFEISVLDDEAERFKTIGDIVDYVYKEKN